MTKEELIERMDDKSFKCESQEEWDLCVIKLENIGIEHYELEESDFIKFGSFTIICEDNEYFADSTFMSDNEAKEFLSWFKEEAPKKKRCPKPKLNKREKLEARLSQVEETTKKAFTCEHNGKKLGSYDGHYWLCSESGPEEAVVFAKWILDLEGK